MRKAEDSGQPISSSLIALACANPPQMKREYVADRAAQMPSPGAASPSVTTRLRESPRQPSRVAQPYGAEAVQLGGGSAHRNSRRASEPVPRHGRNPGVEDDVCDNAVDDAPADGSKLPDITKWNWTPCENRPELLVYHDGKKRWFHCSKCEYWNDRLYHTKMHYERIHVKQGRSMPRKRKYVEVDQSDTMAFRSPDKRPAAEAGSTVTPHRQDGGKKASMETPKGKGVQSNFNSTNKSTPLAKSAYAGAQSPTKGGRSGKSGSKQSGARGSLTSSPSSASCAGGPGVKAGFDGSARAGAGSKTKEPASRIFIFGSLFFQDKGPRLAFDVASWCKSSKRRGAASKADSAARRGKANASPKKGDLSHVMAVANPSSAQKRMKILPGNCFIAGGSSARTSLTHALDAMARPPAQCSNLHGQDGTTGRIGSKVEPMRGGQGGMSSMGALQQVESSGLSDASPPSSPVRSQVFAPATPVHQRPSALCVERSPALGDGMQALDGMQGLTHGSLLSGSVSTTERRQAFMYSENLGLTSAPDSSPSKMYVPSSPPMGSVMSDINAMPPMSGGCLYDASPSRHQYNLRSPPMTPTTNRCFLSGQSAPPSSAGLGRTFGRVKREGSSEIFSPLDGKTDAHQSIYGLDSDNLNLLCNELMSPFHAS